jgi:hypothetical protein
MAMNIDYKFLKTSHPGGIRTRDLLFCRGNATAMFVGKLTSVLESDLFTNKRELLM